MSNTARVTPLHPLPRASLPARLGFRLALLGRFCFTARMAWRRAFNRDDATLACALVRHAIIPPPSDTDPDRDWLCRLLQEATKVGRNDGKPMARDAASGLSVLGALLAAGASPRSERHTGADSPFALALFLARLDEAATMLAEGAFTESQARDTPPLDRLLSTSSNNLHGAEWARLQDAMPLDEEDVLAGLYDDLDIPPLVRWKAFRQLLAVTPETILPHAFSPDALSGFAEESGLRPAIQMALWAIPGLRVEDFLVNEVVHQARPAVVKMLQAMQAERTSADAPPPETLLVRVLAKYETEGRAPLDGFIEALRALAAKVPDLAAVRTPSGETISHLVASNPVLIRNERLAATFAALGEAGLPNQSDCRDHAGQTPLQAMEATATRDDWRLSQWRAAVDCMTRLDHANRLAVVTPPDPQSGPVPTTPHRPRRRA